MALRGWHLPNASLAYIPRRHLADLVPPADVAALGPSAVARRHSLHTRRIRARKIVHLATIRLQVVQPPSVLNADNLLCSTWDRVRNQSVRNGRRMSASDAWIAATVLALSPPLVTNNAKDTRHLGNLPLVSAAR